MGDLLRAIFLGLIPPTDNSDFKLIYRWRVNVAVTLGVLVMTVSGFAGVAFGFLTFLHPGFASASDLAATKDLLNQIRIAQADNEIFEAHDKECQAMASANRDMAVMYERRVQEKLPTYYQLSGHSYQLQRCPTGQ